MSHSAEENSSDRPEDPARTVRIGYTERDAAIEVLRSAAGDGRISVEELEERMVQFESAHVPIDLDEVLGDLTSELPSDRARAAANSARHGDLARTGIGPGWSPDEREILHAPWTGLIRRGRWPVVPYLRCEPAGVLLELNFLEVITDLSLIDIDVAAQTGTLKLVVPEGWGVDITELKRTKVAVITFKANEAAREGHPTVRVHGNIRSGVLQARGPNFLERRNLRQ